MELNAANERKARSGVLGSVVSAMTLPVSACDHRVMIESIAGTIESSEWVRGSKLKKIICFFCASQSYRFVHVIPIFFNVSIHNLNN